MSTPTGQSDLQPLQARHRSRASWTAPERKPSVTVESGCPCSISNSSRARPRVECSSARVTWYDGHITPPWGLLRRQAPTPTQRSTAEVKLPPSSG